VNLERLSWSGLNRMAEQKQHEHRSIGKPAHVTDLITAPSPVLALPPDPRGFDAFGCHMNFKYHMIF
jgi:hypothetical protein